MKRYLSILLAALMILALAAPAVHAGEGDGHAKYTADGKRIISLGMWWDTYYDSRHTDIYDDPALGNPVTAQMRLDKMREIEEKYNVVFRLENLTWAGVQESIATSIMAGAPDMDIYMVSPQFGIPAALSGLAYSLQEMGLEDTDIYNAQDVMKYLDIPGIPEHYLFNESTMTALRTYPLAFNMDMIREANLENPQDLYDRGEWTWDKWREYLTALTRDIDGDGEIDVYGWSGFWTNLLSNLLFSNGTGIATGPQETMSAPATIEVVDLIYTIYNIDRTARPWDESNWDINNTMYTEGKSAFWIGADWIFGYEAAELPFEIGVVPWPRGPQGDDATNKHSLVDGNFYMIPKGIENPRLVYDVLFDWINWYNYDRAIAEDLEWSMNCYMTERNFDYAFMMASKTGLDLRESLGLADNFSMVEIMNGEKTAAQYAEEVKQIVQDALDNYFK